MIANMRNFVRAILVAPVALLLQSCASVPEEDSPQAWKQLVEAAAAGSKQIGSLTFRFKWQEPGQRLLVMASAGDDKAVLYRIRRHSESLPYGDERQVNCNFNPKTPYQALLCNSPGSGLDLMVRDDENLWSKLADHAALKISNQDAYSQKLLKVQFKRRTVPRLDLTLQRHPFEWGGEHETVENAQAFLEALTARGVPMRSDEPWAPELVPGRLVKGRNEWATDSVAASFTTVKPCMSVLDAKERNAVHTQNGMAFTTVYGWHLPIYWQGLRGVELTSEGITMWGWQSSHDWPDRGVVFLRGWNPRKYAVNSPIAEDVDYNMESWEVRLAIPNVRGLRERAVFAASFLQLACSKLY
jgi:hypothetical protein